MIPITAKGFKKKKKKAPFKEFKSITTPWRKFSGFFVRYTRSPQSENAILNSWGKSGQKK